MAVTATVFLGILFLSFNYLSAEVISSKSSGISHVVSKKKDGQDRRDIVSFERIEPTAEVNTSGQDDGKSHPYLVDNHHNDHDNDRHHHDDDRHDHDDDDNGWLWFGDDDDDGWVDDDGNHHHDNDRDHHDHDHDRH